MGKRSFTTAYITRTGLFLALALIFQIGFHSFAQPIVGPLVNLVLLLSAGLIGTLSGIIIGCFTPLIAFLVGIMKLPPLLPAIIIGNVIFVALFNFVKNKISKNGEYIGLVIAALGKFAFLAFSVRYIANAFLTKLPAKQLSVIIGTFSLPQLYTALAGGIVALIVMKLIPKKYHLEK